MNVIIIIFIITFFYLKTIEGRVSATNKLSSARVGQLKSEFKKVSGEGGTLNESRAAEIIDILHKAGHDTIATQLESDLKLSSEEDLPHIISLSETDMVEPLNLTPVPVNPPPLPPRPEKKPEAELLTPEKTGPSKLTQDITVQREKIINKQTPPPLPPRPQIQQPEKGVVQTPPPLPDRSKNQIAQSPKEKTPVRPFSGEDLEKQKGKLKKPAHHERAKTKEEILKEQLEKNVMSSPVRQEEESESYFSEADWE